MKQNFFDQLDGGWDDIIADTYKEANKPYILNINFSFRMEFKDDKGLPFNAFAVTLYFKPLINTIDYKDFIDGEDITLKFNIKCELSAFKIKRKETELFKNGNETIFDINFFYNLYYTNNYYFDFTINNIDLKDRYEFNLNSLDSEVTFNEYVHELLSKHIKLNGSKRKNQTVMKPVIDKCITKLSELVK